MERLIIDLLFTHAHGVSGGKDTTSGGSKENMGKIYVNLNP